MKNILAKRRTRYHSPLDVYSVIKNYCYQEANPKGKRTVVMDENRLVYLSNVVKNSYNLGKMSFDIDIRAGDLTIPARFRGTLVLDRRSTGGDGFVTIDSDGLDLLGVSCPTKDVSVVVAAGISLFEIEKTRSGIESFSGSINRIAETMLKGALAEKSEAMAKDQLAINYGPPRPLDTAIPFVTLNSGMVLGHARLRVVDSYTFGRNICDVLLSEPNQHKADLYNEMAVNGYSLSALRHEAEDALASGNDTALQDVHSRAMPHFISAPSSRASRAFRVSRML